MSTLMCAPSPNTDAATLPDLWRRRTQLSNDEMVSIYLHVQQALRSYYPPELRALREDKDELIAQFIYSKVLRLDRSQGRSRASPESAPSSPYAICAYFRRYLIDCLRNAFHQRHVSIEMDGVETEVNIRPHTVCDPVESVLTEYALSESRVRQAASAFIAGLDHADRIILAGSLGQCSEHKGGLSSVAAAHRVPSYHYRAIKLGVTVKKTSTSDEFAHSKIGRWLTHVLGIAINVDNHAAILVVLNLLAEESSRTWADVSGCVRRCATPPRLCDVPGPGPVSR
jgi:hypothetical protein